MAGREAEKRATYAVQLSIKVLLRKLKFVIVKMGSKVPDIVMKRELS